MNKCTSFDKKVFAGYSGMIRKDLYAAFSLFFIFKLEKRKNCDS